MPAPDADPNLARGVELTEEDRQRIRARYPRGRRGSWVAAALVIAVLLGGWMVWAGLERATPGVSGQLHGYRVVDDQTVVTTVKVHRPDPGVAATCTVQAQAISGEVVGERTFPVSGSTQDTTQEVTLHTSLRATTAILVGCQRT
ncbi:DUF4307 domain-containing protein [Aestuariimicrobium sp. T2.26MG-19.2B]|uniref:DUF4307 domain-containing protein n=1 Tax=Aestuariimicrobium sp. T2.26MG-19.2B TaxID=3040679 RepID=UPI00247748CD|nr:DUF4307 domain-containing protein [Aestuariimicrobium sp. T2.26MG-19.2B]CAI9400540.1 hypothetical protein AESSP_00409 [Aestuariimicrobium sp. T2.26MG-19.2B]